MESLKYGILFSDGHKCSSLKVLCFISTEVRVSKFPGKQYKACCMDWNAKFYVHLIPQPQLVSPLSECLKKLDGYNKAHQSKF